MSGSDKTQRQFSRATRSGCGFAQSATGIYCPIDRKIQLDAGFFQDLERRFRACNVGDKSCQFSQAYVIAYETASSNQLRVLPRVQRRNAQQIRSTKSRSPRGAAARKQEAVVGG
jgi:predicted metalloprotease